MRFWDPLEASNSRSTQRQRSVLNPPGGTAKFGARPMFSRPDETRSPQEAPSLMAQEARLNDLVPTDLSVTSKEKAQEAKPVNRGTILTHSFDNVSGTPTDAEFTEAFGDRPVGFTAIVIDGGGAGVVHLVVKSKGDTWWFETLTKAV